MQDPFETKEYGPDATRYMISANPWDNLKFDLGIAEVRRKFFGTLYNIVL
jgi:isoleucyl-tRNA synthetase